MLIRRASLGLLFVIVFFLTDGVAHSVPMGGSGSAEEQANLVNNLIIGDINDDGFVTGLDFILFRGCYLDLSTPGCESADIDGNQIVDLSDFGLFAASYANVTTPPLIAPEPGTLMLVAAGCIAIALGRRRSRATS